MKMLRSFSLPLVIVSLFILTACASAQGAAQTVVELPSPIQLAILSAATFVVGFVFTKVAEAIKPLGDWLGEYVDEVSTAVAGGLILAIQNWLNAVPPEWEGVANAALALVVAVLAALGLIRTARKVRVPGFRG